MSKVVTFTKKIGLESLIKRIENRLKEVEIDINDNVVQAFILSAKRFLKNPNDIASESIVRRYLIIIGERSIEEMNQKDLCHFLSNHLDRLEIKMIRHFRTRSIDLVK